MADARELISKKVALGTLEERLADVASGIVSVGAHYCAVLDASGGFAGLVRLAEVAGHAHSGNRILADLVSPVKPLVFRVTESAESIAGLFKQYQVFEGVVLDDREKYVGIVTAESVLEWTLGELTRRDEALQQARARLATASEVKEVFIRTLSHELRTPLNPVLLIASEGAANPHLPREVREQFGIIEANVMLEAHLIDGLLDLAEVKRGTIRLDLQTTDMNAVLRSSIQSLRADVEGRGVVLDAAMIGDDAVELLGDAVRLRQAMTALFRNCLESVEQGARIQIASQVDLTQRKMIITFSDEGRGLTRAEIAAAFDPFSRIEQSAETRPAADKFSLGLTLARAIIVLHAGTIELTSGGRGLGASYVVELPIHSASEKTKK